MKVSPAAIFFFFPALLLRAEDYGVPTSVAVNVSQTYHVDDIAALGPRASADGRPAAPTIDGGDMQVPLAVSPPAHASSSASSTPVHLAPPPNMAATVEVSVVQPKPVPVPAPAPVILTGAQGQPLAPPVESAGASVKPTPVQVQVVQASSPPVVPSPVVAVAKPAPVITSDTYQVLGVQVSAQVEAPDLSSPQPLAAVPKVAKPVRADLDSTEVARQVSYMDSQLVGGVDSSAP